ncbi:selenide, water dikinase SelD [Chitinimonas arctica]|uniref:Selenide, water dikinase n=1 Tax=Chitinimonas arctica TaxID=2594795 RepID=A0A516SDC9_9NEIS|nr:selenide, water dikinase SelD [Chitinimonas arctica]QDQ26163.1 selenide, water dikinase SelD [Chitinimonas arctica]
MTQLRLTQLSHGGGCGCKIAPAMLAEMLAKLPATSAFPNLLVGTETADDAAVYRLNDQQALVATTDFFMPIVDDPFDFGRIAATNALSDIYAMGATPIMALAIVGMPIKAMPVEAIQRILAGGASVCAEAGIPIAGGHSIDAPEPIYGLVAMGLVAPERIKRNSDARAGDVLILGKPLGVGVLGSAMKQGLLDEAGYRQLIATTTQLNRVGSELAALPDVHAMTDVTGFGLLGHLLEMCRGAGLAASLDAASLPWLAAAADFARQGIGPGAIERNLASFGAAVDFDPAVPDWQRRLLADAQTSGGLLLAVAPDSVPAALALFHGAGFGAATVIGRMMHGHPHIEVHAVRA